MEIITTTSDGIDADFWVGTVEILCHQDEGEQARLLPEIYHPALDVFCVSQNGARAESARQTRLQLAVQCRLEERSRLAELLEKRFAELVHTSRAPALPGLN